MEKTCPKCTETKDISQFFKNKTRGENSYHSYCKSCNNNHTKQRQLELKQKCVNYLGGKCQECGYDKCLGALQFHHLDPTLKSFQIGQKKLQTFAFLVSELDKCILLCANCHAEKHTTV